MKYDSIFTAAITYLLGLHNLCFRINFRQHEALNAGVVGIRGAVAAYAFDARAENFVI
ncbi:MAG: hypothetical protein JXA73_04550 [Acidobacteria bacterium]|nr:hypothetical protein [Acidobacteriota bacterium]